MGILCHAVSLSDFCVIRSFVLINGQLKKIKTVQPTSNNYPYLTLYRVIKNGLVGLNHTPLISLNIRVIIRILLYT